MSYAHSFVLIFSPGDAVSREVSMGRADIGIAGIYLTSERARDMDMSFSHSQDCAVFITLTSTALPRLFYTINY
jgi:ATP phosphoribosyltransferase